MPESMNEVEILLVEDNPTDAELALRALSKNNCANKLVWAKDGAEALDFVFCTGAYSGRPMYPPKVISMRSRSGTSARAPTRLLCTTFSG